MEQSPNPLNSAWLRMQGAAVVFLYLLQHQHMGAEYTAGGCGGGVHELHHVLKNKQKCFFFFFFRNTKVFFLNCCSFLSQSVHVDFENVHVPDEMCVCVCMYMTYIYIFFNTLCTFSPFFFCIFK